MFVLYIINIFCQHPTLFFFYFFQLLMSYEAKLNTMKFLYLSFVTQKSTRHML